MHDAFPDGRALECFAHRHRLDQGCAAAVHALYSCFELVRADFQLYRLTYSGQTRTERKCSPVAPIPHTFRPAFVERQNLTMRMSMRRFTRLTNGFSKKVENMRAAVSLHFAHYNFVRVHRTLRVTPAMAADVADRLWSLEELVDRTTSN